MDKLEAMVQPAGLCAAAAQGPVIPVFIVDEVVETHGAAPKWRLGLGAEAFGDALRAAGSGLVVRRGEALDDPARTGRGDRRAGGALEQALRSGGAGAGRGGEVGAEGRWRLGAEPCRPCPVRALDGRDRTGGFYKVYTPFWKAVRGRDPGAPLRCPN
jgi:deoxyribodipyrimidine photo-lyase